MAAAHTSAPTLLAASSASVLTPNSSWQKMDALVKVTDTTAEFVTSSSPTSSRVLTVVLSRLSTAPGIIINCRKTEMAITFPKVLVHGMNREHLRLNNPSCKATETAKHFTLTTSLTGCGTTSKATKDAIVYTNRVMEIPVVNEQIITRVRDVEIPFHCYYSKVGVTSAVSMHLASRKLVVSQSQRANFTIALEIFPDSSYSSKFSREDFPVSVSVRKRIYFQLIVETNDKKLSMMAEECFATPTQDRNNKIRYQIIKDG